MRIDWMNMIVFPINTQQKWNIQVNSTHKKALELLEGLSSKVVGYRFIKNEDLNLALIKTKKAS